MGKEIVAYEELQKTALAGPSLQENGGYGVDYDGWFAGAKLLAQEITAPLLVEFFAQVIQELEQSDPYGPDADLREQRLMDIVSLREELVPFRS